MPDISNNNLILLGRVLQPMLHETTENKSATFSKDNTKPAETLAVTGNNVG
jgi:hypothetical protein